MIEIILKRILTGAKGTYGVLIRDGHPLCVTLELPWKNNEKDVSCIPEGEYEFNRYSSTKYKNIWRLEGVPDRTDILIHAGNTIADFKGCIGAGKTYYNNGIYLSQDAIDLLRHNLPDTGKIKIINCY